MESQTRTMSGFSVQRELASLPTRYGNNHELRPAMIFCTCLGFIWGLIMGIGFAERGSWTSSEGLRTFYAIIATLALSSAVLMALSFWIIITHRTHLSKVALFSIVYLAASSIIWEILWLLTRVTEKNALIEDCAINSYGYNDNMPNEQKQSFVDDCRNSYSPQIAAHIVVLVITCIVAILFIIVAAGWNAQNKYGQPLMQHPPTSIQEDFHSAQDQHETYALNNLQRMQSHDSHLPKYENQGADGLPAYDGPQLHQLYPSALEEKELVQSYNHVGSSSASGSHEFQSTESPDYSTRLSDSRNPGQDLNPFR